MVKEILVTKTSAASATAAAAAAADMTQEPGAGGGGRLPPGYRLRRKYTPQLLVPDVNVTTTQNTDI